MSGILLLIGIPGCGKSTWAKNFVKEHPQYVRVCRDDLRFMLGFGWTFNKENEKIVKETRDDLITKYLALGKHVIVDEMNLGNRNRNYFQQKFPDLAISEKVFDTDVNECIRRDAAREHSVGKKRILELWQNFYEKPYKSIETNTLRKAIIVDLDGTLSLFHKKNPYNRDFENDKLNDRLNYILHILFWEDLDILIVSGRSDEYLEQTCKFLEIYGIEFTKLFMRKKDDKRSDVEIKREIYHRDIKDVYNVLFVFDDRKQMKRYWVSEGLYVFDCNQHDVEF